MPFPSMTNRAIRTGEHDLESACADGDQSWYTEDEYEQFIKGEARG